MFGIHRKILRENPKNIFRKPIAKSGSLWYNDSVVKKQR
jgi:hypothetical protein